MNILIMGDKMCYVISIVFYLIFYLFALMMGYLTFNIYHFLLFALFLFIYQFIIKCLHRYYFIADAMASALIVMCIYLSHFDISLCTYFFLMYFVALESFTYTYIDITKYDNSLTKL